MELIGYVRVSTDEQSDQMQRDALVRHGVKPEYIFSDVMTGSRMDRPGLKRAIKVARRGDKIVVWKLDRLGRSTMGVLDAVDYLTNEGIELVSVTESIDTQTPMGRMFLTICAAFAQMERDLIAERTKEGVRRYKAAGGKMGRRHFVLDYPKRLAKFKEIWPLVHDGAYTAREFMEIMREADKDAPMPKRPQSFYNWRAKGFNGFEPDTPLEDVEVDE